MEEKYVFTRQDNSFVWGNGVTRVEFCIYSKGKTYEAIRWDNKKLWGHKLTRRIVGETDVYEVSKRARVNCELYDVFLGRRAVGESRFGLTFLGLKREHVEQLLLCLREYLLYVKKGED